ncbi:ABC transporter substrate-binding protein [Agrobacterium rhizogenes]|uniref:Transporter peptide-binding protein n=1 Tax=Rhizobium rhizogenes (strain K84 / ATCC BAA-868) TaxID=311403 RepID=B9JQC5_RHIR8|nr:ABC transporter substrate-binding protein [Rhizobium rhizogenes]ACM31344.1 transporter peptide-binding protein [Rhizobium rhizogenes K84]OCJ22060.1 peptide ABC transporter substrate-binding protein [Agrobacterium sp. B131/95]OCJ24423.1 peptide ABC transporter substrate-binding protein [Agrobacterium sp. B133/95]NTI46292.1 ABC transporter substrate-binding protein [Rhizobium rhizogenes]NTI52975.1 ABC transporter substrate-binding protein [Rhizobium rhizogenes]
MLLSRRTFTKLLYSGIFAAYGFIGLSGIEDASADETKRTSGGEITFLLGSLDSGWGLNEKVDIYTGQVWGQIADKLVHVDEAGKPTPWIAESWEANADQSQFVLHLKKGVTFSDGARLDAAAVAANIEIWAKGDPSRGIGRLGLFPSSTYIGTDVVDDHTVRVKFSTPTLSFLPTLGYHKTLLRAPTSLNLPANELGDLSKQIGSGPFVVESWHENDNVVLRKRPDYNWGPVAIDHSGPASLDRITFKVVKEAALRGAALEAGQADVALNIPPQELAGLRKKGFTVIAPTSLGFVSGFRVNTKAPYFAEAAVRQAIQSGINRQEILDTVFTPDWKPAKSFIEANVPEVADFRDILAYDPAKSRRLLDEAGWTVGDDGVRARNGEKLRFNIYASPWVSTSKPVDEVIVQQLREIGIAATLNVVDVPTFNARVRDNDTVPLVEVSRSFLDAGVVGRVLTDLQDGDNWFNYGQTNETLNNFTKAIDESVDYGKRANVLREVQKHVLEQGLFIPTTQLIQRLFVQSPKLHGDVYSGAAYPLYYGAWLDN